MQRHAHKTSRYAHLARLLLIAFSIVVLAAPQTLADPGTHTPLTRVGADDSYDFISGGWLAENFSWRHPKTTPADRADSPASLAPITVSRTPVQSSCAPQYDCFGFYPVCWYELLNSEWNTSCTPEWVFQNGYQPIVGNPCTIDITPRSTSLVVLPDAGTFYQDFFVPYDATGALEVEVRYQTHGNGTHWDRIHVELWEGNTRRGLYRFPSDLNCGVGNYTFSGNYAGKNLRLKVTGSIVTPGVEHHIESIRLLSYIP